MIKWLERLSLDAVLVAVVWGYVLSELSGKTTGGPILLVLALSTWLTYVADRLRDVGNGKETPATDRHLFYKHHRSIFYLLWGVLFVVDVILAWFVVPGWKFLYGLALVGLITIYLSLIRMITRRSLRIVFKRLAVPLIFTSGVVLMVESWHTPEGIHGSGILLVGALANLFLISWWEDRERRMPWLLSVLAIALALLCFTGTPGVIGAIGFSAIGWAGVRNEHIPLRGLADGILIVMALVLLGSCL